MYLPKNPPNPNVDPDAFRAALASGELLTAHQAAQLVGIPTSTFNYHLRLGRIPAMPNPASKTSFVTRADAERFARRLKVWREALEDFDWLVDEMTDEPDSTEEAIAASA